VNDVQTKLLALVLGFVLWAALGYLGKVPLDPLIALLQMGLGGLITHMLQGGSQAPATPAAPVAPAGQAGRSLLELLIVIAMGVVLFVAAGCTTTTASMYSGLYTQAKAGVQVFDDNTLSTMRDLVCAQPYSAIQRHPELQPGIVALCGPLVNTASLDPGQVASMLSIAKQLGLTAPPAAASK
jgi:hypothetical protein